jgi:hypothetical protein
LKAKLKIEAETSGKDQVGAVRALGKDAGVTEPDLEALAAALEQARAGGGWSISSKRLKEQAAGLAARWGSVSVSRRIMSSDLTVVSA